MGAAGEDLAGVGETAAPASVFRPLPLPTSLVVDEEVAQKSKGWPRVPQKALAGRAFPS